MGRKKRARSKFGFLKFSYIRGTCFFGKSPGIKWLLRVNRTSRLMPHLSSTVFNGKLMYDSSYKSIIEGIRHSKTPKFKNVTLQFNKEL